MKTVKKTPHWPTPTLMSSSEGRELMSIPLPEDWYVEPASEHYNDAFRLPPNWWVVVSPDDGIIAALPTHEMAFAYFVLIAFGRGGPNPARPDFNHYARKEEE